MSIDCQTDDSHVMSIFSLKNKSIQCPLLQIFLGALRVKYADAQADLSSLVAQVLLQVLSCSGSLTGKTCSKICIYLLRVNLKKKKMSAKNFADVYAISF